MSVNDRLRHHINPLHIYCRLCRWIGKGGARKVSLAYERFYRAVL